MDSTQRCAIKIIQKDKGKGEYDISELAEKEIQIAWEMDHDNILNVYEASTSEQLNSPSGKHKEVYFMAMEYATNGELFDLVFQTGRLSEDIARYYFVQLLDSLEYVHNKGIHHCDIKLNNILLDWNYNLKLSDFGLSSVKLTNETMKGSGEYMAPEIILGQDYNGPTVDLFAVGVVLFGMIFGTMPFFKAVSSDAYYKALAANRPDLFWKIHLSKMESDFKPSESLLELLTMMLSYFPLERPSLAEIKAHDWYRSTMVSNKEVISEFKNRLLKLKENDRINSESLPNLEGSFENAVKETVHRGLTSDDSDDFGISKIGEYLPEFVKFTSFVSVTDPNILLQVLWEFWNKNTNSIKVDEETYTVKVKIIKSERKSEMLVKILKFKDEEKYWVEAFCESGNRALFNKTFMKMKSYFGGHVYTSEE